MRQDIAVSRPTQVGPVEIEGTSVHSAPVRGHERGGNPHRGPVPPPPPSGMLSPHICKNNKPSWKLIFSLNDSKRTIVEKGKFKIPKNEIKCQINGAKKSKMKQKWSQKHFSVHKARTDLSGDDKNFCIWIYSSVAFIRKNFKKPQ